MLQYTESRASVGPNLELESVIMHRIAVVFGILLILLALIGYFVLADPDARSLTALIPAVAGVPVLVCGLIAAKPAARKHAMHVAMVFALLGAVAPWMKLASAFRDGFELNEKTFVQLSMSGLCLILLVLGIRSFIAARRNAAA